MTESPPFSTIYNGDERESIFGLSLKNLAPGTYYFRLTFFTLNTMGIHTGVEETPGRIYFKVIDTFVDKTGWLRQYWGSVRLDDIKYLGDRK